MIHIKGRPQFPPLEIIACSCARFVCRIIVAFGMPNGWAWQSRPGEDVFTRAFIRSRSACRITRPDCEAIVNTVRQTGIRTYMYMYNVTARTVIIPSKFGSPEENHRHHSICILHASDCRDQDFFTLHPTNSRVWCVLAAQKFVEKRLETRFRWSNAASTSAQTCPRQIRVPFPLQELSVGRPSR